MGRPGRHRHTDTPKTLRIALVAAAGVATATLTAIAVSVTGPGSSSAQTRSASARDAALAEMSPPPPRPADHPGDADRGRERTPSATPTPQPSETSPEPKKKRHRILSRGSCEASYYGIHGRTASGETYDPDALTAAHRTLPLGSKVRVINRHNDRSVIVRINDRGPFVAGRCLDLSSAAMQAVGGLGSGVIPVRYEVLA